MLSKKMSSPMEMLGFGPESWCGCFAPRPTEPPEITLSVVKNDGVVSLQPVTPTLPMPDCDEIDLKFSEIVVSFLYLSHRFPCRLDFVIHLYSWKL